MMSMNFFHKKIRLRNFSAKTIPHTHDWILKSHPDTNFCMDHFYFSETSRTFAESKQIKDAKFEPILDYSLIALTRNKIL